MEIKARRNLMETQKKRVRGEREGRERERGRERGV